MLLVRRLYSLPAFSPTETFELPDVDSRGRTVTATTEQKWTAESTDPEGNYLLVPPPATGLASFIRLHISPSGQVDRGWMLDNGRPPVIRQGSFPESVQFERTEGVPLEGSFAAEILYSGRAGDVIRLLYREYVDGLVRPAFTQELTYDLAEDSEIRFRSIVILVEQAGSSGITYRVVDDGGLSWLPG